MSAAYLPDDRLKSRLVSGSAVGCHWLTLGAAVLAELAADAGAESIVIDMQHGRWDRVGLENAILGIGGRAPSLVRTADASDFAIGSALDAGAHGVIVPMINSAAECASAVAAAHYPPLGRRSGGGARPGADFVAYRAAMADHMLVAVMIETVAGLETAEAIAAVPRLGMVFVGPNDLSLALGEAQDSPAFEAALTRILAAGKGAGTPVGIYTGNADQAARRVAQGFQFVVVASDVQLNRAAAKTIWDGFRKVSA
jgi:2-dehydro-3-deoxyglucarate aldolase/4-hydroxy-2-oxoheptanedioate aldolase